MTQRERTRDPYPWTWEPFALAAASTGVVVLTGTQLGRSVANRLVGGAWRVPSTVDWVRTAAGVLTGNASAGLNPADGPFASPALLYICVGVAVAISLAAAVCTAVWVNQRWGTGRIRGVATPAEVSHSLGRRRLASSRRQIRPDLYREQGK